MSDIFDKDEQEILDLFKKNKLKRSQNSKKEIMVAEKVALNHMKKDERINIRLSRFDLDRIKKIAVMEGLPYQTFISSILHKYADNFLGTLAHKNKK